eukprot:TRINITY_DN5113_c0_g4_i1.p2 TRINITY_DN5113_c0_g4~~TRINITY_DN5113_c0_g4_i1.p2  ORF type:complete len:859 (+),score=366.88 TRINITY_DN5113_c0_g4_i1:2904-5480(+)
MVGFPVSADWSQLSDRFYRKMQLYEMSWQNMDLAKYHLVAAPFGGPLALWRDERKLVQADTLSLRPTLAIYTSAGRLLSSTIWERERLVGCGWTDNDRLVCVVDDGTLVFYSLHAELTGTFSLGRDVRDSGVRDCRIWGSGLVVLTDDLQLLAVTNFAEPRPIRLHPPGLTAPPKTWAVLEPSQTQSLSVEVLLATDPSGTSGQPGTIVLVTEVTVQDQLVPHGPFSKMAVAPGGRLVACFNDGGKLCVYSADFVQLLSEFDTKSRLAPAQMEWCGADTILLYWPAAGTGVLLMVGPFNEWIKYTYDDSALIYLVPEVDGARIISNRLCEFVQRVPDMVESVFKTGSTTPPATLYDALDEFERKSPKADELMRELRATPAMLAAAVSGCLQAAADQPADPAVQRTLLKAASFGMLFQEFAEPSAFVSTCRTVRLLNDVSEFDVGIGMTHAQYQQCGVRRLLERLVEMHEHLRAYRIADSLGLRRDRILLHWACAKVRRAAPDSDPSDQVVARLTACGEPAGISYAEIAATAYRAGRKDIATRLLEYEPRAAEQVPLLLSMGAAHEPVALAKALESGDADLVYLVILQLQRSRPPAEFVRLIRSRPAALDLLISYCRQQDVKLLKSLYADLDQPQERANLIVFDAYRQSLELEAKIAALEQALAIYSETKDSFDAKATEEQIKLLLVQSEIDSSLGPNPSGQSGQRINWIGLPLGDTLFHLIQIGQAKKAAKLKADFKVPETRFYWLKINALAGIRDWASLERLAKDKKPPIGFAPFADVCLQAGEAREAAKYIPRISELEERGSYWIQARNFVEAVETAKLIKELDKRVSLLSAIRSKATDKELQQQVDALLQASGAS